MLRVEDLERSELQRKKDGLEIAKKLQEGRVRHVHMISCRTTIKTRFVCNIISSSMKLRNKTAL